MPENFPLFELYTQQLKCVCLQSKWTYAGHVFTLPRIWPNVPFSKINKIGRKLNIFQFSVEFETITYSFCCFCWFCICGWFVAFHWGICNSDCNTKLIAVRSYQESWFKINKHSDWVLNFIITNSKIVLFVYKNNRTRLRYTELRNRIDSFRTDSKF